MLNFIAYIISVALLTAFIVLLLRKQQMYNDVVSKMPSLLFKMLTCDFCISFWLSFAISILLAVILNDYKLMILPLFTTSLTRYLL